MKIKKEKDNIRNNIKIILASSSPRRKEIFKMLSLPFEVKFPNIEEVFFKEDPIKTALENSLLKTKDVVERYKLKDSNILVISADTIVVLENKILGKPKSKKEAFNMLKGLSGKTHKVITSVGIYFKKFYTFYDEAIVTFKKLTDEEINWYINTKEPLDKAGSYGIQGIGSIFIKEIKGDFFTVMGFPVSKFYDFLKVIGLDLKFLIKLQN